MYLPQVPKGGAAGSASISVTAGALLLAGQNISMSATASGLTTPGAPTFRAAGPTSLYMQWTPSTISTGELPYQYRIYRATSAGGPYTQVGVSPTPRYVDSGLSNSTSYYYKVDCQDEALNTSSQGSNSAAMTTLASNGGPDYPAAPQVLINTRYQLPTGGTTYTPTTAAALQTAINNCALGDVIVLDKTVTYDLNTLTGNHLILKNKSFGTGWIYIVTSDYAGLPAPGTRVTAADASHMPTLKTLTSATGNCGVYAEANAHHYRFVGINFSATGASAVQGRAIQLDAGVTSSALLPNNFVFDRCINAADTTHGGKHGFMISANYVSIIECHLPGWCDWDAGDDSQAIWINTAAGPFKVRNSRVEGMSENIMAGGSVPDITNIVPSDLQYTGNHNIKPLSWANGSTGANSCKNLFEVKNGVRWLVSDNIMENFWNSAQAYCVSFKSSDQSGTGAGAWCRCTDVMFSYNWIKNVSGGPTTHGHDDSPYTTTPTTRVCIRDNIIEMSPINSSGGSTITPNGYFTNVSCVDVIYEHNTEICYNTPGGVSIYLNNTTKSNWATFRDNIFTTMQYGSVKDADGNGSGTTALAFNFTNYVFTNNVMIGGTTTGYPAGNFVPANNAAVGFTGTLGSTPPTVVTDYKLTTGSTYHNAASDGTDCGADVANFATAGGGGGGGGSTAALDSAAAAPVVGASNVATTGAFTVTAGSTIIAFGFGSNSGALARSFSDSQGNTYIADSASPQTSTNNGTRLTIYRAENAVGGSCQVSFTDLNTNAPVVYALAVKGVPTSSVIDVSAGLSNNTAANPSLTVTTTGVNEFVVGAIMDDRPADSVGSSNFTVVASLNNSDGTLAIAYGSAPTAGTYGPAWTGVTSGRSNMLWTGALKAAP